jgi:hypothetical protein
MAVPKLVLVDTCIWVQFFNRPRSREKAVVDSLLDDDRAALVGPILTEILLGFRREETAAWVASVLRGLRYLQVTWNEWRSAARLGRELSASGHKLPLSDLVVASVALERDIEVYTSDPDFDLFLSMQKHVP